MSWVIEEIPTLKFADTLTFILLYVYILNENFKPCVIKPVFFQLVLQYFVGAQFDICREGFKDLCGHGIVYRPNTKFSGQMR